MLLICIRLAYSRDLCFQDVAHNFMDSFVTDIAVEPGAYPEMNLFIASKVARNLEIIFQLLEDGCRQRKGSAGTRGDSQQTLEAGVLVDIQPATHGHTMHL